MSPTRLLVAYDRGSVTVPEIVAGLSPIASLTFVVPDPAPARSQHVSSLLPLLSDLGEVVTVSDALNGALLPADGVVTFSERMVPVTARLAERYRLPTPGTAGLLTDKHQQRRRLIDSGVDVVQCVLLTSLGQWNDVLDSVGVPMIMKPVRGEGSRNVHLVTDPDAGRNLAAKLLTPSGRGAESALVVEELLVGRDCGPFGDYVSVESAVANGVPTHLAVTGKLPLAAPFRETGQFWPDMLSAAERRETLDLTGAALAALDVGTGLTHTEIKLTASGPRIIEVNARMGGHINDLSIRGSGVDLVGLAGKLALGQPSEVRHLDPHEVVFQQHQLAPLQPCRVASVDGVSTARHGAYVDRYRTFIRPGTCLPGGVGTAELDMLCGRARDHDEMLRAIQEFRASVTFSFLHL